MAACPGTAPPTSLPPLPSSVPWGHLLREAVGGCEHPVSGEQGPATEVRSIIAKTDLPWPLAQAGVLASHNAVYGQLPTATVCERGESGGVGAWKPSGPALPQEV